MRLLKPALTLLFILGITQVVFSNPKLFPGYYITLKGDTVTCKVEFHDWGINPNKVTVETAQGMQSFGVTDIKGFGVFGYCDYLTATVIYHKPAVTGSTLPEEFSDKMEDKACFLKVIVTGYYSLYELALPERAYYFIREKDGELSELVYRVKQVDNAVSEDLRYRDSLFILFSKEGSQAQFFGAINQALYRRGDLKRLTLKLNINHPGVKVVSLKTRTNPIQFDLFAGASMKSFPTTFDGIYEKGNKAPSSTSLAGGINFLYRLPLHFSSFALGFSLGYTSYKFTINRSGTNPNYQSANANDTTTYTEKISSANSLLMGNIYALYFINPLGKTQFFLKAGLSVNLSLKNDRDIYSTYTYFSKEVRNGLPPVPSSGQGTTPLLIIKNSVRNLNFDIGLIQGRHKAELSYYLPVDISSGKPPTTLSIPIVAPKASFKVGIVGLFYYYTIFK